MRPGRADRRRSAQAVDAALARPAKTALPADLIVARTSDQPLQVRENVDLFMQSLYEAIVLVVLVSLIGFWEWRSALLMALSIPITLAMTFGMMHVLGIDLQQVSIASLIIALGLLVDDPVVAGDAIKRELAAGQPPIVAAWLGPTKLATAILFATITNIVAYLPFLLLHRRHRQVHLQPAGRAHLLAGGVAHRVDDVHPAARLLPAAAAAEAGAADRRAAHARLHRRATTGSRAGRIDHRWAALGVAVGPAAGAALFASRGLKIAVLPEGPVVPVVRRRLAARGRAALGDQRDGAQAGRDASSATWPTSTVEAPHRRGRQAAPRCSSR